MASATSPTTGCACYCTAASRGRLTGPQDCEAAPHAWWRRALNPRLIVVIAHGNRGHFLKPLPSLVILNADCEGASRPSEHDARVRLGPGRPPKEDLPSVPS